MGSIGAEQTDYIIGTYIVLGVGMVMTLVGFLGCCGSWKESPWMLATFFVFLIIILVGEVAIGVLVYTRTESYEGFIRNFVETTVVKKPHTAECMSVVRQVDPDAMPYQQIHKKGCAD